jgi:hypothetical protein
MSKRIDLDEYERTTFPPIIGFGQAEGFFGWLPPIILASVVGVVTAVIAWNLWLLSVVTVVGAVLGVVVGLGGWVLVVTIDKYWLQLGTTIMYVAGPVLWIGGPATTILVGVLVLTYVPDLSLAADLGLPPWLVPWLFVGSLTLVLVARFLRHFADRG